ncbi:MAG: peroxiredoxin family protein [Desertimonas sp.]
MSIPDPPIGPPAPPLTTTRWFNTPSPPTLDALRGQVVVIEAFQMLCPGCVSHGLPQAQRIQRHFGGDAAVLGLHTVFEHHEAMRPVSLEAFLHEYRIDFPVGVDAHETPNGRPVTMTAYGLQGTPSLVVLDRLGRIRLHAFGHAEDLAVGAAIARLIDEPLPEPEPAAATCTTAGCTLDQTKDHR